MRQARRSAEPAVDYGAQPWRVMVEDRATDPDRPQATNRRARKYDALRWLEARRSLDRELVVAGDKFRDDWGLVLGAREGVGEARLEPWQRCHYAQKVADARQRANDALLAVGLRLSHVFVLAVIPPEEEDIPTVR